MKVLSLFLAGALFLNTAKAQDKYIEVAVSDTVLLPADQFVFQVMAMPDMYMETTEVAPAAPATRMDYAKREREMRLLQKRQLDTIEAKLKRAGFVALPAGIQDMMASRGFGNYFLTYQLTSVDALKRFQDILKTSNNVNAMLQSATSKSEEQYQQSLYAKLMEKAKRRAEQIALTSGKKIGTVLLVTENTQYDRGWYPYGATTTSTTTEAPAINANYPLQGRLIVRFTWN